MTIEMRIKEFDSDPYDGATITVGDKSGTVSILTDFEEFAREVGVNKEFRESLKDCVKQGKSLDDFMIEYQWGE